MPRTFGSLLGRSASWRDKYLSTRKKEQLSLDRTSFSMYTTNEPLEASHMGSVTGWTMEDPHYVQHKIELRLIRKDNADMLFIVIIRPNLTIAHCWVIELPSKAPGVLVRAKSIREFLVARQGLGGIVAKIEELLDMSNRMVLTWADVQTFLDDNSWALD